MPYPNAPFHAGSEQQFRRHWPRFLERFGERLSSEAIAVGERLQHSLIALQHEFAKPPITVCHGDLRYDNLFFESDDVAFADWQVVLRGRGARDAGYFMSQSVRTDDRRACEMAALRRYHETLFGGGVRGYSFDECFDDYRRAALYCLLIPVIGLASWDTANERALTMLTTMLDRAVATIVDLNCGELIPT